MSLAMNEYRIESANYVIDVTMHRFDSSTQYEFYGPDEYGDSHYIMKAELSNLQPRIQFYDTNWGIKMEVVDAIMAHIKKLEEENEA